MYVCMNIRREGRVIRRNFVYLQNNVANLHLDMPNTKSSDIRYKVLDRCLRRGGYSTVALMNKVSEELEFNGYPPVTALNTVRNDLRYLEATYPQIHIIETKSGRNKTYAYEDPDSSIFRLPFSDEELGQLSQCMAILSQFEGMPQMEWLQDFMERFRQSVNIDLSGKQIVGFDECPYLKGKEHFSTLLSAICEKKTLRLSYQSFKNQTVAKKIVYPHYIKEYNNRWFMLAMTDERDTPSNFALDRIEAVEVCPDIPYKENKEIDFQEDYFSDIVGVSRNYSQELQEIILRVDNATLPYISTKPLHGSQKVVERGDTHTLIKIAVIPNFELQQLLLSHGPAVTVVSPAGLKQELSEKIARMLRNYE